MREESLQKSMSKSILPSGKIKCVFPKQKTNARQVYALEKGSRLNPALDFRVLREDKFAKFCNKLQSIGQESTTLHCKRCNPVHALLPSVSSTGAQGQHPLALAATRLRIITSKQPVPCKHAVKPDTSSDCKLCRLQQRIHTLFTHNGIGSMQETHLGPEYASAEHRAELPCHALGLPGQTALPHPAPPPGSPAAPETCSTVPAAPDPCCPTAAGSLSAQRHHRLHPLGWQACCGGR